MGYVVAKVAISKAVYAIDRPYDYLVPRELEPRLQPGVRVLVPFGAGNRGSDGIVLALRTQEGAAGLKEILAALDEEHMAHVRNEKLGFVFQDFLLLDGLTIRDNIMLPRIIGGRTDASMEKSADMLCDLFGISHIKNKFPADVSGGERQRTAVARALINDPELILADEPTGNLDSKSAQAVIDAFLRAKNELSATIFMVTHDSFAASFCDRVVILKDGDVRKTLVRKEKDHREFQDALLDTIRELSEVKGE